jgi:hypothetical protein
MHSSKPDHRAGHESTGLEVCPRTPPDLSAEQARWIALIRQIRQADADAAQQWVDQQWRAVWLLLRRRLGAAATPELARTALGDAVTEVRAGRITGPGHLIRWLNQFALSFDAGEALPRPEGEPGAERFPVSRLVDELRKARADDREALRRYYVGGQSLEQLGQDLNIDRAQFLALRIRMRALVSRKPLAGAHPGRTRTAGAA